MSANYSTRNAARAGIIGGFVGSLVLGVLAELDAATIGQDVFYVTVAKKLGFGDYSLVGGWILHFITGMIAGAVIVLATTRAKRFTLTSIRNSIQVGIPAGAIVWVIVYVPITGILVSSYLTDPTIAIGSLILHMLYGVVTTIIAYQLLKQGAAKTTTSSATPSRQG